MKATEAKGVVRIGGKEYSCEVRNGEPYIDGKTVEEFRKTLDHDTLMNLAQVGGGGGRL